jgi:histone-lysine N-methyltransferase SETMAR
VDPVKDAPHARRPKTTTSPKMVEKVNVLIVSDGRFTTRYIALGVDISVGAADTILRDDLKMRRISARWLPHLLTKEQKHARVRISKQLLKQFSKYNNRSLISLLAMRRGFT